MNEALIIRTNKNRLKEGEKVTYELHMWLRKIIMEANKKSCSTCSHYDGKFGDDKCFSCLCTVRAVEYERRTT